ncbi:hypothetical protein HPB47_022088, partial [Ixodes persulcatus]
RSPEHHLSDDEILRTCHVPVFNRGLGGTFLRSTEEWVNPSKNHFRAAPATADTQRLRHSGKKNLPNSIVVRNN